MAGVVAVVLFVAGVLIVGERPPFDASAAELAQHVTDERTQIQLGVAVMAASMPFLVWFFADVARVARDAGARAGGPAFGFALVFIALFLVDITTLAVAALRPERITAEPELATLLRDLELLLMGTAAFMAAAMLVACAVLALKEAAVWPRWVGWLALVAAPLYLLRVGTLFTTDGPFAADGLLGVYVPVGALAAWLLAASVTRARSESALRSGAR